MYAPPVLIKSQYLEGLVRLFLEKLEKDLTCTYVVMIGKVHIPQEKEATVYKDYGPCGPPPFFTLEIMQVLPDGNATMIVNTHIGIAALTPQFNPKQTIYKTEKNMYAGWCYNVVPNTIVVPDELKDIDPNDYWNFPSFMRDETGKYMIDLRY